MELCSKVPESQTLPKAAELLFPQPPNCVTSEPEVLPMEAEEPSEENISIPHVNVIVKEEEEEEPLYGT